MTWGISFLTVTGIMWVVMGAVISRAAQKQLNIAFIQGIAGGVVALAVIPALCTGQMPAWQVVLSIFLAGFGNYYIFLLMNKAMQTGPNGLVWAMIQSAFIIPFAMGIIFFAVPCSLWRLSGLLVLLLATALMGIAGQKSNREKSDAKGDCKWLWYTIIAFLMGGLDQALGNLPSYLIKEEPFQFCGLLARSGICGAGFAVAWAFHCLFRKENWFARKCTLDIVLMAGSTVGATVCLFYALDTLAKAGAGAIGYPLGMGITIAAFQIYTAVVLKEKLSLFSLLSILLCLSGIVLIML